LRDYEDMLLLLSTLDNSHLLRPSPEEKWRNFGTTTWRTPAPSRWFLLNF